MTDTPKKPNMGDQVNYYDPKMTGRVGLTTGWRGRGTGPYLAFVTNEKVEGDKLDLAIMMPQSGGGVMFVVDVGEKYETLNDRPADRPYWDWASPLAKAADAVEVDTTLMTPEEVIARLIGLVRERAAVPAS